MRDLILRRTPKDFDIITSAELKEVCFPISREKCPFLNNCFPVLCCDFQLQCGWLASPRFFFYGYSSFDAYERGRGKEVKGKARETQRGLGRGDEWKTTHCMFEGNVI